jgi:DNA-binding beta-propeller fold protein YncE
MKKQLILVLSAMLFLCFSTIASAAVQKGVSKEIKTAAKPIDIAVSTDGKKTFVLLEGGIVQIFDLNGRPEGTIEVSKSAIRIETSPNGEALLLADNDNSTINVVALDYLVDINIEGSPFKGQANAPVVIAEFSCFQ